MHLYRILSNIKEVTSKKSFLNFKKRKKGVLSVDFEKIIIEWGEKSTKYHLKDLSKWKFEFDGFELDNMDYGGFHASVFNYKDGWNNYLTIYRYDKEVNSLANLNYSIVEKVEVQLYQDQFVSLYHLFLYWREHYPNFDLIHSDLRFKKIL